MHIIVGTASNVVSNNYNIDYVCVSDCNYLLSCVRDDTLRLIDLRTNKIINTFEQVIFYSVYNVYIVYNIIMYTDTYVSHAPRLPMGDWYSKLLLILLLLYMTRESRRVERMRRSR